MGFDTKHDVPTMIANYRKERCAEEFLGLLTLSQNIDLKVLESILPQINGNEFPNTFADNKEHLTKKITALTAFCQTIQSIK